MNLQSFATDKRTGREVCVLTTHLPYDHGWGGVLSLWYETRVYPAANGKIDDLDDIYGCRYGTREEAEQGHEQMVAKIENGGAELRWGGYYD